MVRNHLEESEWSLAKGLEVPCTTHKLEVNGGKEVQTWSEAEERVLSTGLILMRLCRFMAVIV